MSELDCDEAEGIDNGDEDIMMKIVSLQNFDGSWSPSKELNLDKSCTMYVVLMS
jgi:hypothetical protein